MTITAAQLALRAQGFGSSDPADIVLGNGMRTWLEKTGQKPPEPPRTTLLGRHPIEWGNRLEKLVLDAWEEEFGRPVRRDLDTIRSAKHPLAFAHLDGLTDLDGDLIVEAKAPGEHTAEQWDGDQTPEHYQIQAQWQMGVTGIRKCHVAALVAGQTFIVRPQVANDEDWGNLVEVCEKFWRDFVETRKPPPVDGSEVWSEYIARRWPKEEPGKVREATEEELALLVELRDVKATEKAAKARADEIKNALAFSLGDTERLEGLCTYKLQKGSTFTTTRKAARVLRLAKED